MSLALSPFPTLGQSGAGAASAAARETWTSITTTKVKPEMRGQYEALLKQEVAAYKKAGALWFQTLETFAGDTTEFTTIVPVMKFADLERAAAPVAVMGKAGWENLSNKMARSSIAQTRQFTTPLTAFEINSATAPVDPYWVETRSQAVANKMDDYLTWLRDEYVPAIEKGGVPGFRLSIAVFGAAAGEVVSLRMLSSLAEIDGGSILAKALGPEGARAVNAKGAALVVGSTTRILRTRSDLSY